MRLRNRLLLLVLAALLPVALFAAATAWLHAGEQHATFRRGAEERTLALLSAVDAELLGTARAVQVLSHSENLASGDMPRFRVTAERVAAAHPHWHTLRVARPNGTIVLDLRLAAGEAPPPRPPGEQAVDKGFAQALRTRQAVIGELAAGPDGAWRHAVHVPVAHAGEVRHVLTAVIEPKPLAALVAAQHLPAGWVGVVLDSAHRIAARTVNPQRSVGQLASQSLRDGLAHAPQGWFRGSTLEGLAVYTPYHRSATTGWVFAMGIPADAVDAPAWRAYGLAAAGLLAALALASVLAVLFGRRITEPIARLAAATEAVRRGERVAMPPATGVAEIGRFARTLQDTLDTMREREDRLAHALAERDRAEARLLAELAAQTRLQQLGAQLVQQGDLQPLLQAILAAAAELTGTDKGNIQRYDARSGRLRIVVHQGLGRRLVEHFAEDGWVATCDQAARQVERVIVEDVARLDELRGTVGLEIVLADGIRAIQSTPLVSRDGRLLGMLNNHYRTPGGPDPGTLRYIDLLARQAADLLERHDAEVALRQADRHKDQFLAMLSHELRNPLAALTTAAHVLRVAAPDDARMKSVQGVIDRQTRHMVRLIEDLLDITRVRLGKLTLKREPLNLAELVQDVTRARRDAGLLAGRAAVQLDAEPVWVVGDRARLEQVYTNLLDNALKFTPAGGLIRVGVHREGTTAALRVADNGQGIAPEHLPAMFELFVQGEQDLGRAQGGLGLGLALVQRLVELHFGRIEAASEGAGRGATFTVSLPAVEGPVAAQGAAAPAVAGGRRPLEVLVVEDNDDTRQMLCAALAALGHTVFEAADGTRALALAAAHGLDAALLDIGLPDLDGYELARRLRAAPRGRRLALIALSGYGGEDDRARARAAGFDAHVVKPANVERIAEEIERLAGRDRVGA